jgi:integrase
VTGAALPKDWHAGVIKIGGRLYIQFKEHGRWKQRRTGLLADPANEVRARALASELERQIKAEEGLHAIASGMTLRAYAKEWLSHRTGTSAVDDRQRLEQHVLPVLGHRYLGAITTPMIRDLVRALKKKPSRKGDLLAPRTVLNIYGALHGLFASAVEDGKIAANPCKLTGKTLPAKRDKDPTWRDDAIFTLDEVLTPPPASSSRDRRVFYALMFLGCMRFGEASEQRWKDYDHASSPAAS